MEIYRIDSDTSACGEDNNCLMDIVSRVVSAKGDIMENADLSEKLDRYVITEVINEQIGYKTELKCNHRDCTTICTIASVFGGKALIATNNSVNCVNPDSWQ